MYYWWKRIVLLEFACTWSAPCHQLLLLDSEVDVVVDCCWLVEEDVDSRLLVEAMSQIEALDWGRELASSSFSRLRS